MFIWMLMKEFGAKYKNSLFSPKISELNLRVSGLAGLTATYLRSDRPYRSNRPIAVGLTGSGEFCQILSNLLISKFSQAFSLLPKVLSSRGIYKCSLKTISSVIHMETYIDIFFWRLMSMGEKGCK